MVIEDSRLKKEVVGHVLANHGWGQIIGEFIKPSLRLIRLRDFLPTVLGEE